MSIIIKRYLPYILTLIVVTLVAAYFGTKADEYRSLLDISVNNIVYLALLALIFLIINGVSSTMLYRAMGASIGYTEGTGLGFVGSLANLLPLAGGIMSRAFYLRKKHGLNYTRFLSATLVLYICFVIANGFIGLLVLLYIDWQTSAQINKFLYIFFAAMILPIMIFFLPIKYTLSLLPKRWHTRFNQFVSGWEIIRQQPNLFVSQITLQIIGMFIFAVRYKIAFQSVSQTLPLSHAILFASATVLTQLVSIAPGGVGVREIIVATLASMGGYSGEISIVAVGIDRLISTTIIIILGTLFTYILSGRLSMISR